MSYSFVLQERLKVDTSVYRDDRHEEEKNYLPYNSAGSYAVHGMTLRLTELGKHMLPGDGAVHDMKICLAGDGEVYEFSGDTVTEQYQNIIRKLCELKNIDLTANYLLEEIPNSLLESVAEHEIKELVRQGKEQGKNPAEVLRGVTYQVWCSSDTPDLETEEGTVGYISTYGELDGMVYDGENRQLEWKDLPDGEMEIPWMFNFSMEHPGKEDYDRYKRLAERHPNLMEVPGEYDPDNCRVCNDMAYLYLPGGKADFEATMEIARELNRLPNDEYEGEEKELDDALFENTYFTVKGKDEDGFIYFAEAVLPAEAPARILSVKR